jgi:hypothetical protein
MKDSITKAAILYEKACKEAQKSGKNAVPTGTLERIVSDVETEAGLSENSISIETVKSRIKRGNPDGIRTYSVSPIADRTYSVSPFADQTYSVSPIADQEPFIIVFCMRLAKIGEPSTKKTVVQLAKSLVADNEYESKINKSKIECNLASNGQIGDPCYRGFINWHKDVLAKKGMTVKDVKRTTCIPQEIKEM